MLNHVLPCKAPHLSALHALPAAITALAQEVKGYRDKVKELTDQLNAAERAGRSRQDYMVQLEQRNRTLVEHVRALENSAAHKEAEKALLERQQQIDVSTVC